MNEGLRVYAPWLPDLKQPKAFVAAGASFLALFLITAQLVFSKATQSLDAQLTLAIYNANPGPTITSLLVLASKYGREIFWTGLTVLMLLLGKHNTKQLALQLSVLFITGIIAGDLVKLLTYRSRPFNTVPGITALVAQDSDSSFPSGHVLIVTIGAIFTLTKFTGKKPRFTAVLFTIEAAMVSYSRVYLGVHYPLDVLGGVFLAGAIVFLGLFLIERYLAGFVQRAALGLEKLLRNLRIPEIL